MSEDAHIRSFGIQKVCSKNPEKSRPRRMSASQVPPIRHRVIGGRCGFDRRRGGKWIDSGKDLLKACSVGMGTEYDVDKPDPSGMHDEFRNEKCVRPKACKEYDNPAFLN